MNWLNNICFLTDSYKVTHWKQYPRYISYVSSYFEPRRGAKFNETVFFGLQYQLKNYLEGKVVTKEKIDEAEELVNDHFKARVFPRHLWEYIICEHDGMLPIVIKAVAEGTVVKESNVMMTVKNTDPKCSWLTNYLESLLVQCWYPSTVASQSREMKKILMHSLHKTGDSSGIDFKLHDFGFRGVTCPEQAAIGGAAHLINFQGTDNLVATAMLKRFYSERMAGFTIPASEHSTITSWGKENEILACKNMLDQYPSGFVACVSDSFNIYNSCENIWGTQLKDQILARDGVLVIRPDSGDPLVVLPKILEILGDKFGYTWNEKGFKVLHPKVRLIQGDGIDLNSLVQITSCIEENKWSTDNLAFGSGGGLLQKVNRDTQKFAFKCSQVTFEDNSTRDVFKDPITDPGKTSKLGELKLVEENGELITVPHNDPREDRLIPVFMNGKILVDHKFSEIRSRSLLGANY